MSMFHGWKHGLYLSCHYQRPHGPVGRCDLDQVLLMASLTLVTATSREASLQSYQSNSASWKDFLVHASCRSWTATPVGNLVTACLWSFKWSSRRSNLRLSAPTAFYLSELLNQLRNLVHFGELLLLLCLLHFSGNDVCVDWFLCLYVCSIKHIEVYLCLDLGDKVKCNTCSTSLNSEWKPILNNCHVRCFYLWTGLKYTTSYLDHRTTTHWVRFGELASHHLGWG